ncbi:unnamed protein product [Brachionus calyciflorus]|uniref:Uncharacterized protein n=1 Tax=Brachionus calyciflorus TaxID=104777 RepID=A0A814KY35_9BILA|nr:unnamed protein product [Brachionus calyciflorus]
MLVLFVLLSLSSLLYANKLDNRPCLNQTEPLRTTCLQLLSLQSDLNPKANLTPGRVDNGGVIEKRDSDQKEKQLIKKAFGKFNELFGEKEPCGIATYPCYG